LKISKGGGFEEEVDLEEFLKGEEEEGEKSVDGGDEIEGGRGV
jgi:hypothetical protein